ncbi:MAG: siroheme synthase CysG [Sulfuricellaceae bacterium]|jgi:uroporphyrin-III C-methyltransferase/precorrin-2 dehydrogenase/sirohydrochlorin ferrochelatase
MDFFPVFLNLRDRDCLVIGGGDVAARKVSMLLEAHAKVTVVSPELCDTLAHHAAKGRIAHVAGRFSPDMVDKPALIIAATDDMDVNRQVSDLARERNIPVNVVDNPELCSFIVPSIIDRSPIVIAVSSSGVSPVLARLIRTRLETLIPSAYGKLGALAAKFRDKVKAHFPVPESRRRFWEVVLQGKIAEMVFSGQEKAAEAALEDELKGADTAKPQGEVYLVGGGPGNPDLLTFRALRLMQQADVVVYDHLVSPSVLELTRRDADRIYVGKERNAHTMRQEAINELLVKLAKEGKRVLRLKGGDPFIFGRGGEEIETLTANGVQFQVVPGISAALGVSAYAGIPLTHRDYAQSCVFVTGHLKDGNVNLDWDGIARPNQTIVIYMGLQGLPALTQELMKHGLPPTMPAAIVQQGTTHNQKVVTGTLETLPQLAVDAQMKPPTLIIVGEVVKLHDKLKWFKPGAEQDIPSTAAFIEH